MIGYLDGAPLDAARELLGRTLTSNLGVATALVITEVEAYGGADDPASHAYRGRTARNAAMFAAPGTLYVYRSYGIHWCANVVCGSGPGAVLLRGGVPLLGRQEMVARRGREDHLTDGPGKLAQAMGIGGEHDGTMLGAGPVILGEVVCHGEVTASPRIGITKATDRPWRLVLTPRD